MRPEDPVCAEPKLFVGGLSFSATQDDVYAVFGQYGPIRDCVLLTHSDTGRSKGCAMVAFEKWAHAEAAAESENGMGHLAGDNRTLIVKFADPSRREGDGRVVGITPKKLFIGQLPPDTTDDQIRTIFAPYGTLMDVHVMHKGQSSVGCAFVTYQRWAEAEMAIEAVDGKYIMPGAQVPMAVRFADAKPTDIARVGDKRGADMGGSGGSGGPSKRQLGMPSFSAGRPGYGMGYGLPGLGMGMGSMPMMGMNMNPMSLMMMYGQQQQQHARQGGLQGQGPGLGGGLGAGVNGALPPGPLGGLPPDNGAFLGAMGAMAGMGGGGGALPGMMGGSLPGMFPGGPMFGMGMQPPGLGGLPGGPGAAPAINEAAKAWKLFLGQVSYELNEHDLFPFLSQWGTVLELVLLRQSDGRSRGCGFVIYSSAEEAEAALQGANGAVVPGDRRGRPLTIKYAANRR